MRLGAMSGWAVCVASQCVFCVDVLCIVSSFTSLQKCLLGMEEWWVMSRKVRIHRGIGNILFITFPVDLECAAVAELATV